MYCFGEEKTGIRTLQAGSFLLLSALLLVGTASGAVVLNSSERIDFNVSHQRTGLVNATGVDVSGNNVYNLFDTTQCTDYVRGINPDGSYECGTDTVGTDSQNLSEVLVQGNRANTSIDMDENVLQNVDALQDGTGTDTLRFDSGGNVEIPNTELQMSGDHIRSVDDVIFNGGTNSGSGLIIPDEGGGELGVYNASGCGSCKVMTWSRDHSIFINGSVDMNNNDITNIGSKGTYFASDGDLHVSEIGAEVSDSSSVGDPAYTFNSDGDTGIYRPGADQVALTTAGTRGLEVTGSQNVQVPNGDLNMSGNAIVYGMSGVKIGNSSTSATSADAISIGNGASTGSGQTVAIGSLADASGSDSIAIGDGVVASASDAIAMGDDADATGNDAMAFGIRAQATSTGAVAIGPYAVSQGQYQTTFGNLGGQSGGAPMDVNVTGNLTVHGRGGIRMPNGVAIGSSGVTAEDEDAVAIGYGASTGSRTDAVAIGKNSAANSHYSTAIGGFADGAYQGVALGYRADADAIGAVAIGNNANAPNQYEATFGDLSGNELDVNVTGNLTVHGDGGLDVPSGNISAVTDAGKAAVRVQSDVAGDADAFFRSESSNTGENGLQLYHDGTRYWAVASGDFHANSLTFRDAFNNMNVMRIYRGGGVGVLNGGLNVSNDFTVQDSVTVKSMALNENLTDDFDPDVDSATWATLQNAHANETACGSTSGNALYFNGTGTREAVTQDTAVGSGTIKFGIRVKNETSSNPCDEAESSDAPELQYSINDGETWTTINTYAPSEYGFWTNVTESIPEFAQTGSTQFRWVQPTHSDAGYDHWAIDNLQINTTKSRTEPATGIQTTQPTKALDVNGSAEVTGALTVNDTLAVGGTLDMGGNQITDIGSGSAYFASDGDLHLPNSALYMGGGYLHDLDDLVFNGGGNSYSAITLPDEAGGTLQITNQTGGTGKIMRWNKDYSTDVFGEFDLNGNNITNSAGGNVSVGDSMKVYGNVWATGADLAEMYRSPQDLDAGEVVRISDSTDDAVERTNASYQDTVLGVVSSDPSYVMNTGENGYPIALEGKVPVNVSVVNGVIDRGDRIVPSATPGVAMTCSIIDPMASNTSLRKIISHNQDCRDSTFGRALEQTAVNTTILVKMGG